MIFRDRHDAGRQLGKALARYSDRPNVLVLALPRGGVPVAYEVAQAIGAPLDVFLVRKLGFPGNEEYAMGAVASGGVCVLDEDVLRSTGVSAGAVRRVIEREERELRRRERAYRDDRAALELEGRTVILVDDGLATGSSMRAAIEAVRRRHAQAIVVAVPVGPAERLQEFKRIADEVVCVASPTPFLAVGRFYGNFDQTTDEEVVELLERTHAHPAARDPQTFHASP